MTEQELTPETVPESAPVRTQTFLVSFQVCGPESVAAGFRQAFENLAQLTVDSGCMVIPLGEPNKLDKMALDQNTLDDRLAYDRRLVYPHYFAGPRFEDALNKWWETVKSEPTTNATWMQFLTEGLYHAYRDGRITKDRFEDILYGVWMNQTAQAMIHEAVELQASTDWKHWKNPRGTDRENIKTELTDVMHFLLSGYRKSDMTTNDIEASYHGKNAENHARQDGVVEGREDYKVSDVPCTDERPCVNCFTGLDRCSNRTRATEPAIEQTQVQTQ